MTGESSPVGTLIPATGFKSMKRPFGGAAQASPKIIDAAITLKNAVKI
jgi:hypothetical protein